jgi:hypothetical protein
VRLTRSVTGCPRFEHASAPSGQASGSAAASHGRNNSFPQKQTKETKKATLDDAWVVPPAGTATDLAGNTAAVAGPSATFIVDSGAVLHIRPVTAETNRIDLTGVPSVVYTILATSNFQEAHWEVIGGAPTDTNGAGYMDARKMLPTQYYRAVLP